MFGFGNMFGESYEVTIEVYIGKEKVQQQTVQAPKEFLIANFMQLAQQIKNDTRPMKIRMTRPEVIYDNFKKKQKTLTLEVVGMNNAMVSFEGEPQ